MVLGTRVTGAMMGGVAGPCAYVHLSSLGALGPKVNNQHASAIAKHVQDTLGIDPAR